MFLPTTFSAATVVQDMRDLCTFCINSALMCLPHYVHTDTYVCTYIPKYRISG